MTIAPLFSSPCDLAERMPAMVADFLELETKTKRRFREDSVTDIIIASLLRLGGTNATVLTPPEVRTGGDFDILIIEPETGEAIQYRIQAKRLSPHSNNWTWGSYRELDHPHGQGKQASALVRSSAKEKITTIPLYAFYNPESVCKASSNSLSGIELADGRMINQIVKSLVKAKSSGRRPRLKRIERLRDLFFPFSTLLCPPVSGSGPQRTIISPDTSRQAVQRLIAERATPKWMREEEVPALLTRKPLELPSPSDTTRERQGRDPVASIRRSFPPMIENVIERGQGEDPIRIVAKLRRPKLVLVSRTG